MNIKKIANLMLALAFVGSAISLVAPTAQAQQSGSVTIQLSPPSENVKPLQGPISFSGTVTLTSDGTGYTGITGIPVTYTVTKQPAWATVLISPATDVFPSPASPSPATQYTVPKSIVVTVTASDQAPGFQADQIEITATTTSTPNGKALIGKGAVPITAGYFSILDTQLAETIKVDRPQTPVIFPLKITNLGNANTKVTFAVTDKSENLQVPVPNPITLQSKQAGGNQISADVPLTVQTPYKNGYLNEVGLVNFKITSAYALDPKFKGDESSVAVVITTKGFYVPGVEIPILVGILGAAALVLRRR